MDSKMPCEILFYVKGCLVAKTIRVEWSIIEKTSIVADLRLEDVIPFRYTNSSRSNLKDTISRFDQLIDTLFAGAELLSQIGDLVD
jgi:hypothetical protein